MLMVLNTNTHTRHSNRSHVRTSAIRVSMGQDTTKDTEERGFYPWCLHNIPNGRGMQRALKMSPPMGPG